MIAASEALKRAIERGLDREHLGALYSGPSIAGPRRVTTTLAPAGAASSKIGGATRVGGAARIR
jgi:hypothetical protein